MKRRTFLKDTALLVAAASTGGALKATEKVVSSTGSGTGKGSGGFTGMPRFLLFLRDMKASG